MTKYKIQYNIGNVKYAISYYGGIKKHKDGSNFWAWLGDNKRQQMKLYHYSNKELNTISVKFFGANSYTFNDKKASDILRSFFYLEQEPKEYHLKNSKYCYIVDIEPSKLYDLKEDKDGLKVKYKGNINGLLEYIRNNFLGCIYNVGFDIVILFEDMGAVEIKTA